MLASQARFLTNKHSVRIRVYASVKEAAENGKDSIIISMVDYDLIKDDLAEKGYHTKPRLDCANPNGFCVQVYW